MAKSMPQPTIRKGPHGRRRGAKHPAAVDMHNSETVKCTICSQEFTNLQECLKHELLQHSTTKHNKRPQKSLRTKLNAILNAFKEETQLARHTELRAALNKCEPGQELNTIFKYNRMNDENLTLVYERISACLKEELDSLDTLKISPFGSFVSGLALRDSDIDLYIEYTPALQPEQQMKWNRNSASQRNIYNRINGTLHRSVDFGDVIAIRHARVPIIKCKHLPTGFSLDINLSCPSSVHNTNFLRDLMKFDNRLHELMVFLKVWAKLLQIVGRCNMTSYCLITLVIFYLQQKQSTHAALLPAMKTLQSDVTPLMVIGVNYAYDLRSHMDALPHELTIKQLIQGFFHFYRDFSFEQSIVAPYLGESVPLEQFKSGAYKYPAYENQLRAISILNGKPAETFQVERCVCVQDPFSLNHNVGKAITSANLDYFRHCLKYACEICDGTKISTDAQIYDALLYDIVPRVAQVMAANNNAASCSENSSNLTNDGDGAQITISSKVLGTGTNSSENLPSELIYRFTPGRAELRAIEVHAKTSNPKKLHQLWVQHYIEAITEIITDIYCIDMQSATPTHSDKQQRLEHGERRHTWLLNGSVDQWTGRLHQRCGNQTFMEVQRAQTAKFAKERRQKADFAVQLNALLTLNIICECTAIEIVVAPRSNGNAYSLCKKDPLRKFFMMFKCSMQNFNLKEKLQGAYKVEGRNKFMI